VKTARINAGRFSCVRLAACLPPELTHNGDIPIVDEARHEQRHA
jgi:hypothetical protein